MDANAAKSGAMFRLLANNVPVLIAYYRADDLQCLFANAQYARTFGFDEQSIIGRRLPEVIGEAAARQIQPHVDRVLQQRMAVSYERQLPGADGAERWLEVNLVPHIEAGAGTVIGAFVMISDITRHRLAERAVRESEERMARFMDASAEGILFHRDGVIVDANQALCELTGYPLDELLGRRNIDFVPPDQRAKVQSMIDAGQETAYESALIDRHQQRIPVEYIGRTMLRNGERSRMTIVRDLRDRQAVQQRMHHLAHHDALTGLPNRMAFMDRLALLMAAQGTPPRLAVLFIDLDHFKRVNDSLGHLAGDALLRNVASRITATLRATDIVARFGGDEFIVLLSGLPQDAQAREHVDQVARKLLQAIEAPLVADGRPISVTPSIGIAMLPGDGDTPDLLIRHADAAMYLAKTRGRANHQYFDHDTATDAYAALVLEGQLAQALERGEFVLHFQPQVAASDGRLIGAEALIRWNHPERGLLLPDAFVAVAEQQRLMLPIGQWVLQESVRCALRWQALGLHIAPVAVNLSTAQFHSTGFVEAVLQILPEQGLPPGLLELELTERMLMDDLGEVQRLLARLRRLGLSISIDDFGTGYSSLGHLKALSIDKLKIDRSFVHDLPGDPDSAAIVSAVIQMGRGLGMTVIAEGVETFAQRDFLAGHGCDELQGLLISEPLAQAPFEAWAIQQRRQFDAAG